MTWAGQLVPNILCHIREEAEARDRKEKERKICDEAEAKERLVCEEAERVVCREQRQQEKLDLFLNESITAEEFKRDSKEELERSKVMGEEVVEDMVGMQVSEMEVDDAGEDEVVAEDKRLKGGRKQAPSSPLKPSRKQACASTAIASKPAVMEKANSKLSTVNACDWCCHYDIKCVPTDRGARCSNCKVKHYKCSLVPSKEGSEGKGGLSVMHCTKTAAGGRVNMQEKKEAAKKAKVFHRVTLGMF